MFCKNYFQNSTCCRKPIRKKLSFTDGLMYLVGHIRKIGDFADGTKLFFQPDEEVVDAGAADCHFEVGFRLGHDAESATRLLYDAFY